MPAGIRAPNSAASLLHCCALLAALQRVALQCSAHDSRAVCFRAHGLSSLVASTLIMEPTSQVQLGCPKCRYSMRGCLRCRDPSFQARRAARMAATTMHGPAPAVRVGAKRLRKGDEAAAAPAVSRAEQTLPPGRNQQPTPDAAAANRLLSQQHNMAAAEAAAVAVQVADDAPASPQQQGAQQPPPSFMDMLQQRMALLQDQQRALNQSPLLQQHQQQQQAGMQHLTQQQQPGTQRQQTQQQQQQQQQQPGTQQQQIQQQQQQQQPCTSSAAAATTPLTPSGGAGLLASDGSAPAAGLPGQQAEAVAGKVLADHLHNSPAADAALVELGAVGPVLPPPSPPAAAAATGWAGQTAHTTGAAGTCVNVAASMAETTTPTATPSMSTAPAASARAAAAASSSPAASAGLSAAAPKPKKPRERRVNPYAALLPGVHPDVPSDPRVTCWVPPASPLGLLEEELWQDPWKLLLSCMLLNKTSGKQVRRVIWRLFELCPTPQAAVDADVAAIRDIITPLGLFNKRAVAVQRLSHDYLHKEWRCPTELHGIGKYAADAYFIFCRGLWREVQPEDKDLQAYHQWLQATDGLGTGLQGCQPCQ